MPQPNIIKYFKNIFQTIKRLWSTKEFGLEIPAGEVTRKITTQELFFLYGTLLLDLIYVPTKYYKLSQIIWELRSAQYFGFRGDKNILQSYLSCTQRLARVDQYAKKFIYKKNT